MSKLQKRTKGVIDVQEEEREKHLSAQAQKFASFSKTPKAPGYPLSDPYATHAPHAPIASTPTTYAPSSSSGPKLKDFLQARGGFKGLGSTSAPQPTSSGYGSAQPSPQYPLFPQMVPPGGYSASSYTPSMYSHPSKSTYNSTPSSATNQARAYPPSNQSNGTGASGLKEDPSLKPGASGSSDYYRNVSPAPTPPTSAFPPSAPSFSGSQGPPYPQSTSQFASTASAISYSNGSMQPNFSAPGSAYSVPPSMAGPNQTPNSYSSPVGPNLIRPASQVPAVAGMTTPSTGSNNLYSQYFTNSSYVPNEYPSGSTMYTCSRSCTVTGYNNRSTVAHPHLSLSSATRGLNSSTMATSLQFPQTYQCGNQVRPSASVLPTTVANGSASESVVSTQSSVGYASPYSLPNYAPGQALVNNQQATSSYQAPQVAASVAPSVAPPDSKGAPSPATAALNNVRPQQPYGSTPHYNSQQRMYQHGYYQQPNMPSQSPATNLDPKQRPSYTSPLGTNVNHQSIVQPQQQPTVPLQQQSLLHPHYQPVVQPQPPSVQAQQPAMQPQQPAMQPQQPAVQPQPPAMQPQQPAVQPQQPAVQPQQPAMQPQQPAVQPQQPAMQPQQPAMQPQQPAMQPQQPAMQPQQPAMQPQQPALQPQQHGAQPQQPSMQPQPPAMQPQQPAMQPQQPAVQRQQPAMQPQQSSVPPPHLAQQPNTQTYSSGNQQNLQPIYPYQGYQSQNPQYNQTPYQMNGTRQQSPYGSPLHHPKTAQPQPLSTTQPNQNSPSMHGMQFSGSMQPLSGAQHVPGTQQVPSTQQIPVTQQVPSTQQIPVTQPACGPQSMSSAMAVPAATYGTHSAPGYLAAQGAQVSASTYQSASKMQTDATTGIPARKSGDGSSVSNLDLLAGIDLSGPSSQWMPLSPEKKVDVAVSSGSSAKSAAANGAEPPAVTVPASTSTVVGQAHQTHPSVSHC